MELDLDTFFLLRYAARIGAIVTILVLMTLWKGCSELRYMTSGKTVDAEVTESKTVSGGSGRHRYGLVEINVRYIDGEGKRHLDLLPVDPQLWESIKGDTVKITYIEGKDGGSVVAAARTKLWVVLLGIGVLLMGIFFWGAWQQAQRDVARSRR